MELETKPEAAKSVWELGSSLVAVAEIALAELAANNLSRAIQDCPRIAFQLSSKVVSLQARQWDDTVLGPVLFDLLDGDPARSWAANYAADYLSFKLAVSDFMDYVTSQGDWGTVGLDAELRPEMNLTATTQQVTELSTKLQTIVDTFPTVGG